MSIPRDPIHSLPTSAQETVKALRAIQKYERKISSMTFNGKLIPLDTYLLTMMEQTSLSISKYLTALDTLETSSDSFKKIFAEASVKSEEKTVMSLIEKTNTSLNSQEEEIAGKVKKAQMEAGFQRIIEQNRAFR
ncbi:MAG: hypothetical protein JSS32_07315 [Verrucomicrobia bacterium]|nr:hypothetical protein [Verrucomicrobiota bacterium]